MDVGRFANCLDVHGADFARWPADLRRAAAALLANSLEANRLLREARALDALLRDGPPLRAPTELRAAVLDGIAAGLEARARARRRPVVRGVPWRGRSGARFAPRAIWRPAVGLAACLVLGLLAGRVLPQTDTAGASGVVPSAAVSSGPAPEQMVQIALLSGQVPYGSQVIRTYLHDAR
jgi:hypothetical protein